MPPTKRGRTADSPSDLDDYDDGTGFIASDDDSKPKTKKTKTTKPSSSTASKTTRADTGDSGEQFWEISHGRNSRRVGISEFKGTRLINIREHYQNPAGDFLPGKKGISLSLDQYKAFLQAIPEINATLAALGEDVEAGIADLEAEGGAAASGKANVKAKKAGAKEQRANIDETSDEEGST